MCVQRVARIYCHHARICSVEVVSGYAGVLDIERDCSIHPLSVGPQDGKIKVSPISRSAIRSGEFAKARVKRSIGSRNGSTLRRNV
jgi:hypothetical protein